MSDDIMVDFAKMDQFASTLKSNALNACGVIGADVSDAALSIQWPSNALQIFADHWDVELELIDQAYSQLGDYVTDVSTYFQATAQALADELGAT